MFLLLQSGLFDYMKLNLSDMGFYVGGMLQDILTFIRNICVTYGVGASSDHQSGIRGGVRDGHSVSFAISSGLEG